MPGKCASPLCFNSSMAGELACPACEGHLLLDDLRLVCMSCRRAYPIVDGIPVLIIERAEATGECDLDGDS